MKNVLILLSTVVLVLMTSAYVAEHLPTIPSDRYSAEQAKVAQDFQATRKMPVFSPFEPLIYSPEVTSQARAVGDYLRYHSVIGNTLSESIILITAWGWGQDYEWYVYHPIALKAGIKPGIADVIADGHHSMGASEDEEIVYDFVAELIRSKCVSDQTYTRVEKWFGNKGVVDMTDICGHYTLLVMEINVTQYPASKNVAKLVRFPEPQPLCRKSRTVRSYDAAQDERRFFAVIRGLPMCSSLSLVFTAID